MSSLSFLCSILQDFQLHEKCFMYARIDLWNEEIFNAAMQCIFNVKQTFMDTVIAWRAAGSSGSVLTSKGNLFTPVTLF